MRYSKQFKSCCLVYVIVSICMLVNWWFIQQGTTSGADQELDDTRMSKRGRTENIIAGPPEQRQEKENYVVIVGYGKHRHYKLPVECDCQNGRFIATNDTDRMGDARMAIFTVGARAIMTFDDWRRYHKNRKPSQIWVLGTRESPLTCTAVRPPVDMKSVYNWSMTYHSKADFPTPYGQFHPSDQPESTSVNWYAQKRRLVSWTSSHCPLQGNRYRRQEFVKSLRKHLNISMYGTCGDGRFDGNDYVATVQDHKFVLVFENSCCSEYLSEEFWDALTRYQQVPIVYGATREEYKQIAPPGSYVFVQDFKSLRGLAEYINRVGSDEAEYNKFHEWRRLGHVTKQLYPEDRVWHCHSICRMADRLTEVDDGKRFHFDEQSEVYFGGCRECQKELDVLLSGG